MFSQPGNAPPRAADQPDIDIRPEQSGSVETIGAGFTVEAIETDWWSQRAQTERSYLSAAINGLRGQHGDRFEQVLHEQAQRYGGSRTQVISPLSVQNNFAYLQATLDLAQELNADPYFQFPDSPQALRETANQDLRAQWDEASTTLANGGAISQFLGRAGAAMTDPLTLMSLPLGASGSVARVAAGEAVIGGLSEAALLPRMYEVADELGTPEPNAAAQIGMGALFGGLLGGGVAALMRGAEYSRLRRDMENLPNNLSAPEAHAATAAAEDALLSNQTPPEFQGPPEMQGPQTPSITLGETDGAPVRPDDDPELVSQEIDRIRASDRDLRIGRPTISRLSQMTDGRIQWTRINQESGEREYTPVAQELMNRGVRQNQLMNLVRRQGNGDLDNIVASDFADGGTPRLRTDDTGTYINREDLFDAIAQEVNGTPAMRTIEQEDALRQIDELETNLERITQDIDARARGEATTDPNEPVFPAPRDGEDQISRVDSIQQELDLYEFNDPLPSTVRTDVATILADRGGSLDDAVELAWANYLGGTRYGSQPQTNGASPVSRGAEDGVEPGTDRTGTRASEADDEGAGSNVGVTERTPEGEQYVAPGIDPITERQRLDQAANAPMRGGARPADGGLFDLNARMEADMFDNITSADATGRMDAEEAELRDLIDNGELERVGQDDNVIDPADLLREIENDRKHMQAIETCQFGGPRGT